MMANELVKATESVDLDALQRTAKMLAVSGYFEVKQDMTVAIAQMATKILAGRELGYGPFASASGIHVIKGKPSLGANLMASAVKNHPKYDYRVRQLDDSGCVVEFFENGESLGKSKFTTKDAQTAGLTGNDNWKKYARNMFFARAMSNGVRWYCPDVFAGNAVYVPEELGAETDEEGNVVDVDWHSVEPVDPDPKPQPQSAQNGNSLRESYGEGLQMAHDMAHDMAQASRTGKTLADNPFDDDEPVNPDPMSGAPSTMPDWGNPKQAQQWAVKVGACQNEHEARNSMKKIVDADFGGSLTPKNMQDVFVAFYHRQCEKLAEAQEES